VKLFQHRSCEIFKSSAMKESSHTTLYEMKLKTILEALLKNIKIMIT